MTIGSYEESVKPPQRETFMTLVTNEEYCIGALVLGVSLRQVETQKELSVLVTSELNEEMRNLLGKHYDNVIEVTPVCNTDSESLKLLSRRELDITFTKIHCWAMVQFDKVVFLDADTLVLHNIDELFEREELSAVPDPSWPDCFNAGVFVLKPSLDTFNGLLRVASCPGSFDGREQGLLNTYFTDWLDKGISHRLAYIYNCICQINEELGFDFYTSMAAWVEFGGSVRVAHFSGPIKPWHRVSSARGCSREACMALIDAKSERRMISRTAGMLAYWWSLFLVLVRPDLKPDMYLGDFYLDPPRIYYAKPATENQNQTNTYAPYQASFENAHSHSNRPPSPTAVGPYHPEFHETRWDYLHQGQRTDEANRFIEHHYVPPPTPPPPPTSIRISNFRPSADTHPQQGVPAPPVQRRHSQSSLPKIQQSHPPQEDSAPRGYQHIVFRHPLSSTPPPQLQPPSPPSLPAPVPTPAPPPPPEMSQLSGTARPQLPDSSHVQRQSNHATPGNQAPTPNNIFLTSGDALKGSQSHTMQYDERLPLQQTIKQPVPPSTWKPPKPAKPLQPKYCFDCQNCKREMAKTVSTDPNGIGSHKHETEKLSTMKKITSKPKRVTKPMVRKSHGGKKSEHVSTTKPEERKISRTEQYESHLTNIAKDVPLETIIIPTFQLAQPVIKYSTKKRTRTANYQHTEASLSISQSASLLTNFDADNIKADKLKSEHIRWPHSVEEVYVEKEEPKIKCFSNSVVKVKRDQSRTNETKTEPLLTYKEDVVMRHFQSDITPPTIALHQNQWLAGIQLKPTSDFVHKSAGKANIPSTGKENGNVETKGKTTDVSEALINAVAKKHKNRTLADLRKVREKLKEKGFDKEVHESNWENKRELDEMRRVLLSARPKVQPGTAGHLARTDLTGKLCARHERLETERMYAWERGDIDYTGTDRFANILAKLCDTMTRVGGAGNRPIGLDV
ncbi:Glycogenin-1 [Fasciolopsis buskii]|uniref:glycogenin glucosyltransferase n=1 Tax=Fasciolopsis buskii TaxID=27845 RepID=A0A8E0RJK4_9TREM|nr:Glycogenin-1 [Fasciolopsis buski]